MFGGRERRERDSNPILIFMILFYCNPLRLFAGNAFGKSHPRSQIYKIFFILKNVTEFTPAFYKMT